MRTLIPESVATPYLEEDASRALLILANCVVVLVGIDFYLPQLLEHRNVFLWPVIFDSPLAAAWVTFSLLTLSGAGSIAAYRNSRVHVLLNTIAFVSVLKYGVWTLFTLNYFFTAYYPDPVSYFGSLFVHAVMALEAFLLPYYAKTTMWALGVALVWLLVGDVVDYGFGLYPHLRVEQLGVLPGVTAFLSFASVATAWYCLDTE
ncbi:DUF1405 domain-containing protein [Halobacterium zhouii]|uniref:DUF1405 domain-containing protein n=1 Tax=Halobacterium zhouii TaxID=2902624 RepID=UPI001E5F86FA|nr:DUF1405 domain-containing protein [Halobacterium zhouii]